MFPGQNYVAEAPRRRPSQTIQQKAQHLQTRIPIASPVPNRAMMSSDSKSTTISSSSSSSSSANAPAPAPAPVTAAPVEVVKASLATTPAAATAAPQAAEEPCCQCEMGSFFSSLAPRDEGIATLPTREELAKDAAEMEAKQRKEKLDLEEKAAAAAKIRAELIAAKTASSPTTSPVIGATPSPKKVSSLGFTQSPVKLDGVEGMHERMESLNISREDAAKLKTLSMTEPGVLVGYQIEAAERGRDKKVCVIVGIQSARGFKTEFLISRMESFKLKPKAVAVETWEKLNRKPTSTGGLDFDVLRRVLTIPTELA